MRLTPINISMACALTWFISELSTEKPLFSWGLFVLWFAILLSIDVLFRVGIKNNKKLWFMQLGFIGIVSVASILLKLYI